MPKQATTHVTGQCRNRDLAKWSVISRRYLAGLRQAGVIGGQTRCPGNFILQRLGAAFSLFNVPFAWFDMRHVVYRHLVQPARYSCCSPSLQVSTLCSRTPAIFFPQASIGLPSTTLCIESRLTLSSSGDA